MRLIDLNPLRVGEAASAQPGLSVLREEDGDWVHGHEALACCRLDPQATCPDVWIKLNRDPVLNAENRAWLAVRQLRDRIPSPEGVWAALTPDTWAKPALQVFLGVAKECGLDVRVLMSRAAAVASLVAEGTSCILLEWAWESLRAVTVIKDAEGWRFEDTRLLPEGGIFDFYRRDARVASEIALARTRIDPLDSGVRDQALFDAWWAWRMRGLPFRLELGGTELDFTGELARFQTPHREWLARNQLEDTRGLVVPAGLHRVLGLKNALHEPETLAPLLDRLEEPTQPGARWKAVIPATTAKPVLSGKHMPVTHWVVDGIASPCPPGEAEGLIPGTKKLLPFGRIAMAIHVPER